MRLLQLSAGHFEVILSHSLLSFVVQGNSLLVLQGKHSLSKQERWDVTCQASYVRSISSDIGH